MPALAPARFAAPAVEDGASVGHFERRRLEKQAHGRYSPLSTVGAADFDGEWYFR
jgi:hypothetical protein